MVIERSFYDCCSDASFFFLRDCKENWYFFFSVFFSPFKTNKIMLTMNKEKKKKFSRFKIYVFVWSSKVYDEGFCLTTTVVAVVGI